jgi:mycothiol synthase
VALPPGFRFRPARDQDAAAVAAFANEESEAIIGAPVVTPEWLLSRWTAPSVDRELDVAVVEAPDGSLCGSLSVEADPPCTTVFALGIVAPPFHGRGLGAAIVAETERRAGRFVVLAGSGARVAIRAGTLAGEPRVGALLSAHGYREVRRFELMRIDFAGEPEPPAVLPGIDVRAFRPEDAERLFAAHREAFADHWGEGDERYEDFRHHQLESPEFDADLWFLAWHEDELAGYVGVHENAIGESSRGYIPVIGVRRAYRRRGLGEALVRHAFRALYRRGKLGCELTVDARSVTGATHLYHRLGMRSRPRFAMWEKELQAGRES